MHFPVRFRYRFWSWQLFTGCPDSTVACRTSWGSMLSCLLPHGHKVSTTSSIRLLWGIFCTLNGLWTSKRKHNTTNLNIFGRQICVLSEFLYYIIIVCGLQLWGVVQNYWRRTSAGCTPQMLFSKNRAKKLWMLLEIRSR